MAWARWSSRVLPRYQARGVKEHGGSSNGDAAQRDLTQTEGGRSTVHRHQRCRFTLPRSHFDSQRRVGAAVVPLATIRALLAADSGGMIGREWKAESLCQRVRSLQVTLQRCVPASGHVAAQLSERGPCVAAQAPVSDSASARAPARARPLSRKKAREVNPMRKERKRRQHAARRSRQATQLSNVTGAAILSSCVIALASSSSVETLIIRILNITRSHLAVAFSFVASAPS